MEPTPVTRREAVRKAALAGLVLSQIRTTPALQAAEARKLQELIEAAKRQEAAGAAPRLKLGVATYSLRKLPIDAAVAALQAMQVTSVSVFRAHVPILAGTPEECRVAAQKFRAAGMTVAATGVVTLARSEEVMRKAFECGRAAGLTTMAASYAEPPDRDTFLRTERFVREYDIRLAFHNHGPGDKIFPSPDDVWNAVQPYDERLGLCLDVGHSLRAGTDPIEAIFKCRTRLYDVHLKDTLAKPGDMNDRPVEMGFGHLDLRGIMAALLQIGFKDQAGLEDEVEAADPVPGVAQSVGFMRGLLAGLTPAART